MQNQTYDYDIIGLKVRTNFLLLNNAPNTKKAHGNVDVKIMMSDGVGRPADPHFENETIIAGAQDFVFLPMPGLSFRIQGGNQILISRETKTEDSDINLFLVGSAWGVLLHQRELIPLHCSAIGTGGQAAAFVGQSGAGKSTLAAGLSNRGYGHLCDDVCMLNPKDKDMLVYPMPKGLKLWRGAADALNIPTGARVGTHPDLDKFYVKPAGGSLSDPQTLKVIYVIQEHEDGPARITPLSGAERFSALFENVYRKEWIDVMGNRQALFSLLAMTINHVKLYTFSRQKDMDRFEKGLDVLEEHFLGLLDGNSHL